MPSNEHIWKGALYAAAFITASFVLLCAVYDNDEQDADSTSGKCGDGVEYVCDHDKLTIKYVSAPGTMYDYDELENRSPWYGESFMSIDVEYGVKNIGQYAFYDTDVERDISLPSSIDKIGCYAFAGMNCTASLYIYARTIDRYAFLDAEVDTVFIYDSVLSVAGNQFKGTSVKDVINVISHRTDWEIWSMSKEARVFYYGLDPDVIEYPYCADGILHFPKVQGSGKPYWSNGENIYREDDHIAVSPKMSFNLIWGRGVTVTFENTGDTAISSQLIYPGEVPVQPSDPVCQEYHFNGWAVNGIPYGFDRGLEEDTVITATWFVRVAWKDTDGTVIDEAKITPGDIPQRPVDPVKEGYDFAGWTIDGKEYHYDTALVQDTVISASWEIKRITITWADHDGSVLHTEDIDYGTIPSCPADPVREGYDFAGWTIDGREYHYDTALVQDTVISASWQIKRITITWADHDGSVLFTENIDYGTVPACPADPVREGYDFAGWTIDGIPYLNVPLFEDTVLCATWTPITYDVVWQNYDGSVLYGDKVRYGEVPEYHGNVPVREPTVESVFGFVGWTPEVHPQFGDDVYTAVFGETPRTYGVWFDSVGGIEYSLDEFSVEYGSVIHVSGDTVSIGGTSVTAIPSSEDYIIKGWSVNEGQAICSDTCIIAAEEPKSNGNATDPGYSAVIVLAQAVIGIATLAGIMLFRKHTS